MTRSRIGSFVLAAVVALTALASVASPAAAAKGRNHPEDRPHVEDSATCTVADGPNHC